MTEGGLRGRYLEYRLDFWVEVIILSSFIVGVISALGFKLFDNGLWLFGGLLFVVVLGFAYRRNKQFFKPGPGG